MKYVNVFVIILIMCGCQKAHYIKGSDFIRNYEQNNDRGLFNTSDVIYFVEMDTNNITFLGDDGQLESSKAEHQKELQEYFDWFDMEDGDKYGYANPKEFFAFEFNKNFKYGLNSNKKKRVIVKSIHWKDIIDLEYKFKTEMTTVSTQEIRVVVPLNMPYFCKQFKIKYPDATHAILMADFFIYSGVLTYSVSYNANNYKHGSTILIPKTIIDLNNELIVAYDLNQTPNLYSVFHTIKGGLKNCFELEGKRIINNL